MRRTKLKSAKLTAVGQKTISSFFSPPKQKESTFSFESETSAAGLDKTEAQKKPSLSSPTFSPTKRNILGVLENILPSSPDLLSIPETPDSQIRPAAAAKSKDQHRSCPQHSGDAPCLGNAGPRSPLCRSPRSRGSAAWRRSESGREKMEDGTFGSVKRLFGHEESHNTKRSRTANIQVTNYVVGPKTKSLEVAKTAQGPSSKNNLSNSHLHSVGSEDNQAMFTDLGRNSTSLKPVAESRLGSSRNSSGVSGQQPKERPQADSVFTVIMEQKTPLQGEVGETTPTPHPRTANTEAQRHDAHTLDTRAVPLQEHPTEGAADRVAEGQTADAPRTSPGRDGLAMTSSDADWLLEDKWFDGEMDQIAGVVREEKPNVTRIPDHVILSGGLNNRYWVLDVEERPSDKILTITCSRTLQPRETCRLKDGWEMSPVSPGDVVHLEGRPDSGSWLVDRDRGFLVLLPDTLISGTSTSGSIRCMRRAVLGEIFKSFDGHSKQMLNGTMVHEVFQKAAMTKDFSMEKLTELARVVLHSPQHLSDMYSLGVTQEEMKQELHDYLPSLGDWANDYLNPSKPRTINLKPSNSRASFRQQESAAAVVTVTELTDIEENIWSPRFGLKGKIDVTARVQIQRPRRDGPRIVQECVVPLELKTGKETNSIEHRSQVILYTLMSMERRGNAEAGLLLYLKTGNLFPVVSAHMDCRELLMLRNTLAHHLGNTIEKRAGKSHLSNLPDMVTDRQTCRYCPQRRNCALYERVMQGSNSGIAQDAVGDFLLQETGHLAVSHLEYFSHWLLLCCLESITMETKNSRRHVWLQSAEEREKSGGCVGNLQISGPVIVHTEGVFLHRFRRSGASSRQEIAGGLAEGDRIVVSDQEGRLVAVATGYMCDVARLSVSCTLDRDLSRFRDVVLRLDQDEGVVGLATHLTNLSRLMDNSPESDRLRELVVEQRLPEFISNLSSVLPREAKDSVANILKGLNKPQKQAMKKVLLSKDYTLIVGMPGTGKTTTICTLVRILHACGFSVLLTSYTHSAVDNILLKLKRFRVGFLRLGRGQKVHPDILPYTETEKRKGVHTLSELEQLYNKELVVATTSMGIKHPIFTRRQFDFCIIDEASQISQPVCLGPLFYAKRFVLVGDHQQLPPIVQNREARSLGMDESLFKRLELHSEAVVHLNVQYRMNRQIMSLSNSLMYDGRLESGSERTASALLSLPFLNSVQSELNSQADANPQHDLGWMHAALQPSNPVCFLDTSLVPALETVEQGGVSNNTEAALTHILLSLLIKAGCNPSDIGVIAPYRQQLKSISALLQSCAFSGVEVNTVDRYQGRDKSVIVLSFVRSTLEEGHLGELLKDWRRLNVAVTRAKHKLLMVGSASTLRCYAPLEKLLSHLQQEDMIVQLPAAAHTAVPSMHL